MKRIVLLIAALFLAHSPVLSARTGIVVDGSSTLGPLAKSFAAYFQKQQGVAVSVSESGSGNGITSLIHGNCDIATTSRPMTEGEIMAARKNGVDPVGTVVAYDCIAIIVNPMNPLSGLSMKQIAGIYQGSYSNWKSVGGPKREIVVIQREVNSGTQEAFSEMVLGAGAHVTRNAMTCATNGAMKRAVAASPTAIGFIGLAYVDASLKVLAVDGVLPGKASISKGSYRLARPLYLYTNGQPSGEVKRFVDIAASEDGRMMLQEHGFFCH